MANLEKLKSAEIPGGIKVVIADDEERKALRTGAAWQIALNKAAGPFMHEVLIANDANNFFSQALGLDLNCRPADVVILDDNYGTNYEGWQPSEDILSLLASKREIAFEPIKKPDRGGRYVTGEMPDNLYHPNSIHFALLLRYFGFSGKIIITSGDPPEPKYISREIQSLNEYLSKFGTKVEGKLIDGVLTKPSSDNECDVATGEKNGCWDYQTVAKGDFSEAVEALIDHLQ